MHKQGVKIKFPKTAKKKNSLGAMKPPSVEQINHNLDAPEIAPAETPLKKIIGRPKSIKTKQLTTKFTPEFHKTLKILSLEKERDISSIIEEAVIFWQKNS